MQEVRTQKWSTCPQLCRCPFKWQYPVCGPDIVLSWFLLHLNNCQTVLAEKILRQPLACFDPWMDNQYTKCFVYLNLLFAFLATLADKPRTWFEPSVPNKCSTTDVTYIVLAYGVTFALFRMKGWVHFMVSLCASETFHTNRHSVPTIMDVASNLKPVLFIFVRSWRPR